MFLPKIRTILLLTLIFSMPMLAKERPKVQKSHEGAQLLELFTSEACSSCPPADSWMSSLLHSKVLWRYVIPVKFHVDYWNYLGWRDPFFSTEGRET